MNKLGFGFLRLPQTGTSGIDWPLLEAMVDEFLASGGTYFDTAYTYLDGMSEAALKWAVVERHPRANFQIADKLPGWKVKRQSDCQKYFSEQLDRCGVDYFDVYLLHWLNQANYAIAEQYDEFGFLNRLKAGGRIGKTGFSYHGDAATLEKILQAHPDVDVVQLQINYLDWDDPAMEAHKCYDVAARYGKEIVVMEPVKGGTLADLPEEAAQLLSHAAPAESAASWAIRFAQSLEQVCVVLSGMNTMEQMKDNMRDVSPLSKQEYELLEQVSAIVARNTAIPCTGCRYCVKECPKEIAIPDYFRIYNGYSRFPAEGWKIGPVYASIAQSNGKASDCIHCRACEKNCPQQIPITKWLEKVAKALE
jgi:hypothetical protein